MNFALNYKGITTNTKGTFVMVHDTFRFSLLDGVDNIDMQDKKTVTAYLNKHPKLEKRPGEKGYFLKGYDFIRTEAIKLGATACYFADSVWFWDLQDVTKSYKQKRMHFGNASSQGSGAARMFYAYLYPEIIDSLIDRMCKNADAIKEIAIDPKKYMEKIKLENIKKDF